MVSDYKIEKKPSIINTCPRQNCRISRIPNEDFKAYQGVDFDRYFEDVIGVTKSEKDRAQKVILEFENYHAPYIITKPLHDSQVVLTKNEKTTTVRIDVVLNYELEREILGFGECVKVLAPRLLVSKIKRRLANANRQYEENLLCPMNN